MKESEFEEVYRKYADTAFNAAKSVLRDEQLAEDVLQDVFLKLFSMIDEVREETIGGLVKKAAYNRAIDYCHSARAKYELLKEDVSEPASKEPNPEQILLRNERMGLKDKALDALYQKNKLDYLILYHVEILGRPEAEVAEELDISLNLLRVRLHRSKKWLKKLLGDEARELGLL